MHRDLAAVGLGLCLDDRQSEASATLAGEGGPAPKARLEHQSQIPFGYAPAGVRHRHEPIPAGGPDLDPDGAVGRGVAHGVVHEVPHRPPHVAFSHQLAGRAGGREAGLEVHTLGPRQVGSGVHHLGHQVPEAGWPHLGARGGGSEPIEGEQVTVVSIGIVFRPARTIGRIGLDSAVVLLLYLIGIAGLVAIAAA
jgi:hypothetical protein